MGAFLARNRPRDESPVDMQAQAMAAWRIILDGHRTCAALISGAGILRKLCSCVGCTGYGVVQLEITEGVGVIPRIATVVVP